MKQLQAMAAIAERALATATYKEREEFARHLLYVALGNVEMLRVVRTGDIREVTFLWDYRLNKMVGLMCKGWMVWLPLSPDKCKNGKLRVCKATRENLEIAISQGYKV